MIFQSTMNRPPYIEAPRWIMAITALIIVIRELWRWSLPKRTALMLWSQQQAKMAKNDIENVAAVTPLMAVFTGWWFVYLLIELSEVIR